MIFLISTLSAYFLGVIILHCVYMVDFHDSSAYGISQSIENPDRFLLRTWFWPVTLLAAGGSRIKYMFEWAIKSMRHLYFGADA